MPTTYDILISLHKMFGGKDRPVRQVVFKTIIDAKMSKGTLIRNRMVCMIRIFNKMEILRTEIDGETQVNMVLEALSNYFKQFKLNYNMNKMVMSLPN